MWGQAEIPSLPFHGPGMDVSEGVIDVGVNERYSLTISTSITASNPIEVQIKRINEAMRQWLRARADGCGRLVISIAADPPQTQHILSWAIRLVDQNIPEALLSGSFKSNFFFAMVRASNLTE
jgi:hypothetical protein